MSIGEKLYQLRKKEGISQEVLADSIGVSRQAISKWEQNTVTPDTANLIKLSSHFKVSLEYFTGEGRRRDVISDKNNRIDLILLILGILLIFGSIIATYPMRVVEYEVDGEMFDNALYYLTIFPLNFILAIGIALLFVSVFRIAKRRLKK